MKAKEIRDLTTDEVIVEIEEEKYSKMRLNHAVASLENPVQLRLQRKFIARLKTDLRNRQLNEKN